MTFENRLEKFQFFEITLSIMNKIYSEVLQRVGFKNFLFHFNPTAIMYNHKTIT